ncbi:MAG: sigma-70 family RNA polymerase sigma factor [Polyangiaceae bacterium]
MSRRVASAADAEDVLQDVLVRIQTKLPSLRDHDRLGPWVFRVARSTISDHRRRARRAPELDEFCDELDAAPIPEVESDSGATAEQRLAASVAAFIALLPAPYDEALSLTEIEGLTHAEAARRLGVSLTAMKSRVQRGREKLRESFERCCAIETDARGRVIECQPRASIGARDCKCGA